MLGKPDKADRVLEIGERHAELLEEIDEVQQEINLREDQLAVLCRRLLEADAEWGLLMASGDEGE